MFGRSKQRIAAIMEAERLVETAESRGPRHFVGTTLRGGTEITVEIRSQQLYRSGEPVDRSPQRVFRRRGLSPDIDLAVLPPRGHSTRPDPSRGGRCPTGDADFDARFEVVSVRADDVERLLTPDVRRRLLGLGGDVAELRIDGGQASLHLTFTRLDHEPIAAGIALVADLG